MGSKTYGSLSRNETKKAFFENFIKALKNGLIKYFGEEESKRVLEALSTERIEILNIENFLYSPWNTSDRTIEIYKDSKSADEFFYKSLTHFKKLAESGNSHIEIREFIIAFVDMLKIRKFNCSAEEIENYVKIFLYSLMNMTHESPFYIQLLSPEFKNLTYSRLGVSLNAYEKFLNTFFETYKSLPKHPIYRRAFLPHIEIVYPVFPDTKNNQEWYLSSRYGVEKTHIHALFKGIKDLTENSIELNTALDILENETGKQANRKSLLLELKRIKEENPCRKYPTSRDFNASFNKLGVKKASMGLKEIEKTCVNLELYLNCLQPYFSHIEIDCRNLKVEDLNYYVDAVKSLSLLRVYYYAKHKDALFKEERKFRITLKNVEDLSEDIINFVNKKMKQLKSLTNREFIIDISYASEKIRQKWEMPEDLYIRVISDVHADYNQNKYSYNFGNDFIINCGDTAGEGRTCVQWNNDHIKHGIIVAGNHLGYSKCYPDLDLMDIKNTKTENIHWIAKNFAGQKGILFMSNSVKEFEGVIILGTTLYTDFALYGEEHIEEAMQYAKDNMNDFRLITVPGHRIYTRNSDGTWDVKKLPKGTGEVRLFTPQDHAYYFHFSYNFLKEQVKEYRNRPIIIVTHHAPTPYAISPEYAGSMLNPAFASNLNEFIISNPQIRLWCFGHVHNKCDMILGGTRLVCNPFGYNNENNADLPYNYGTRIRLADIKSDRLWTDICAEEIKFGLIKVYER